MFLKNKLADKALNFVREKMINPKVVDIANVKSIELKDGKLNLVMTLNGLEDVDIFVTCNKVSISPEGDSVTVSDFTSNMPFAENALNAFASKEYKIDVGPMAKMGLLAARKMLNLT